MPQFYNFGNGQDGIWTPGTATDAPIDASCSGSSGTTSLSATNASFAAGQQILIHKTRGNTTTSAGTWEVNYIASYSAGTITTLLPLVNSYQDSGADQSQVLVLKQYSGTTIAGTLTTKAWDGNVGGITAFLCSGRTSISGTLTATGKGFSGASSTSGPGNAAEGTAGATVTWQQSANGNGGGGGQQGPDSGHVEGGHGGGGGYGGAGETPALRNIALGGAGGGTVGNATLTSMMFGGGGGSGGARWGSSELGRAGGNGGGMILIFSKEIIITGSIVTGGNNGSNSNDTGGAGGAGAGGAVFVKGQNITLGSNLITAPGGTGGTCTGAFGGSGGNGGIGRIRVETCSRTGSTNPSASESVGGFNFCGSVAAVIG